MVENFTRRPSGMLVPPEHGGYRAPGCDLFGGAMMAGGAPTCAPDPNAGSRSFFLRGKGANGATPASNDQGTALSWGGAGSISTAQKKWPTPLYGSSIYMPKGVGLSAYVRTTNPIMLSASGLGNTISGWYYFVQSAGQSYGNQYCLGGAGNVPGCHMLQIVNGLLRYGRAGATGVSAAAETYVPYNQWVHIAGCAQDNSWHYLAVDGSVVASGADGSGSMNGTEQFYIFGNTSADTQHMNFYATDVRCYYYGTFTGNFSVPTLPPCS